MYKYLISHIREEGRADSVSQLDTLLIVRVIRIVFVGIFTDVIHELTWLL